MKLRVKMTISIPAVLRQRMARLSARMEKKGIPRPNWSYFISSSLEPEVARLEKEYKVRG